MKTVRKAIYKAPMFLRQKGKHWVKVNFEDVLYVTSLKEASVLCLKGNRKLNCSYHLFYLQSFLPNGFERIHRSVIVNVNHVRNINVSRKSVYLNDNIELKYGETYKDNLLKYFTERV